MSKKSSKINDYNEALENSKPRDYNFSGFGEVLDDEDLTYTNPNPQLYGYEIDEGFTVSDYLINTPASKETQAASQPAESINRKPKVISKKVINKQISQNKGNEPNHTKTVSAYKLQKPKAVSKKQNIPDDLIKYAYDFERMIQHLLKQAGKKRRMVNKMVADLTKSSKH